VIRPTLSIDSQATTAEREPPPRPKNAYGAMGPPLSPSFVAAVVAIAIIAVSVLILV
jgi:hypothetical protein